MLLDKLQGNVVRIAWPLKENIFSNFEFKNEATRANLQENKEYLYCLVESSLYSFRKIVQTHSQTPDQSYGF